MPLRFASLLVLSAALHAAEPTVVTVLDWNIDRGYDLPRIASEMQAQKPDIAVLQEVDRNARRTGHRDVAQELASRLGLHYAFGQAFGELNQGSAAEPAFQGQATLTRLAIGRQRVLPFRRQTSFWKPQPYLPSWTPQRRSGGRIALITELRAGGKELVVYNLHLESRGAGATREAQLQEVLADVGRYPRDMPVIVAGDLNTKYFISHFTGPLAAAGFRDCFAGARPRTHHIVGTLDWIFTRQPAVCEEGHVVREAKASDHYPVLARIRLE